MFFFFHIHSTNYRQAMPLRVSNPPRHRGGVVSSSGSTLSLPPGQAIGRAHTSPLPTGVTSQPRRTHSPHAHMRTPPPPTNSQQRHIHQQQVRKSSFVLKFLSTYVSLNPFFVLFDLEICFCLLFSTFCFPGEDEFWQYDSHSAASPRLQAGRQDTTSAL